MKFRAMLSMALAFALSLTLAGCGSGGAENRDAANKEASGEARTAEDSGTNADSVGAEREISAVEPEEARSENGGVELEETQPENDGVKADAIVIYFSRVGEQYDVGVIEKGNTAIVAEMIAERIGADMFEITPENDIYPTDNYQELTNIGMDEQRGKARPAVAGDAKNFAEYETVFLGYPIWWGDMPMILYTFLESHDWSGKTVIPFCTHGGSGLAGTDNKIKTAVTAEAVLNGFAVAGRDAQNNQDSVRESVNNWLSKLGYA